MTRPHWNRREMLAAGALGMAAATLPPTIVPRTRTEMMAAPEYVARDFSGLLGTPGFSEEALKDHFALYQGYVKNTNSVLGTLAAMAQENQLHLPAASELRRRLGWEFNGMRLHELYFENLGGDGKLDPESRLGEALAAQFGSYDAWASEFVAVGKQRGIGWAALVLDGWTGRLVNTWIAEHEGGHLAACPIILIMDVFEHAFLRDYGLNRGQYIEAFFKAIQWEAAQKRFG
jgi:Fe-Mn family superoxide dismutase